MINLTVDFVAGVVEQAYAEAANWQDFPASLSAGERLVARGDLKRRIDRLIVELATGESKNLGAARLMDEPGFILYPGDSAKAVTAVAVLRMLEGKLTVVKIVLRSPFGKAKGGKL